MRNPARFTGREVVLGYGEGGLELQRRFDHGGDEPLVDVPLDVAVEEPDAGVVGLEAKHDVAGGVEDEGVAAHGDGWVGCLGGVGGGEVAGVFRRAGDGLEVVAMEMEGVFAGVWVEGVLD